MPLTQEEKESIISFALSTEEGRLALSESMMEVTKGFNLFGANHNIGSNDRETKDMAIECLSRYEKNIIKGTVYSDSIMKAIQKIYNWFGINRTMLIDTLKSEKINSRFEILDL